MIIERSNPGLALWRQIAVIFVLLALSQNVWAVEPPSAGSQFQQLPPPPIIQKAVPKIQVEQGKRREERKKINREIFAKDIVGSLFEAMNLVLTPNQREMVIAKFRELRGE